ncbi:hypothetical protein JCM17380_05020 [Desulfosporosinus burensis]
MLKTIGAYMNVPLDDYDDGMLFHVVELMKEKFREQVEETILEDTWSVQKKRRRLSKNEDGDWELMDNEPLAIIHNEESEVRETLEVMTVEIYVKVEDCI